MNVKELRQILKRFPKDAQIVIHNEFLWIEDKTVEVECSDVTVEASCDQDGVWTVLIRNKKDVSQN